MNRASLEILFFENWQLQIWRSKMKDSSILVYGGTSYHEFDERVLNILNSITGRHLEFAHLWYHNWQDGEPGFRFENPENIAGKTILLFSCPINRKYESELKDMLTACKKQYHASWVILVMPFLRFRRQDHEELSEEITRLRWFVCDLKHYGADELVLCDEHSVEHTQKFCDEFGIVLHTCDPTKIYADTIRDLIIALGGPEKFKIYSPDGGSVGRAISLATALGISVVATPKRRLEGEIATVDSKEFVSWINEKYFPKIPISCDIADVKGFHVIMREDELDTGGTAVMTCANLRQSGALSVRFVGTHPVCSPGWKMKLFPTRREHPFDSVYLGNTRPRGLNETKYEGSSSGRTKVISIEPVIAGKLAEILFAKT